MDGDLRRLLLSCDGGAIGSVLSTRMGAPVGAILYFGIVGMLGGWVIALGLGTNQKSPGSR